MMRKVERESKGSMTAGQDLVMTGYAGFGGTVEIIRKKREQLEQWFAADYLESSICQEWQDWNPELLNRSQSNQNISEITEWESVGEGGILKALWNLSGAYEQGIRFSLRRIPIRQETIEICERFELNPYRLYSAGAYLLVSDHGGQLAEQLNEQQIPAMVIGHVIPGVAREMMGHDTVGYLERPQPDEIKKILQEAIGDEREDFSGYREEQQN